MGFTVNVIGIFLALVVLVLLIMNGVNLYLSAIICSIIVGITAGLNVYTTMKDIYMSGFVTFLQSWFLLFFAGAIYGRLMSMTGSAKVVADVIIKVLGPKRAMIALPIAIGLLIYGGINGYVCIFAVFPIILAVFREADAPKRFIPVMYLFASGTFANCGPGTTMVLNIVTTQALGVDPMAAWPLGFIGIGSMIVIGLFWYNRMINQAKRNGEHYTLDKNLAQYEQSDKDQVAPGKFKAFFPLVFTVVAVNLKIGGANVLKLEEALVLSIAIVIILNFKVITRSLMSSCLEESVKSTLSMICATCSVIGFATVVKATPAFDAFIDMIPSIPLPPVLALVVATNIMCGITGTASGAAAIVAPILGPIYTGMGMDPAFIARLIAVSATGCDSVPHNGSIVAYINMCGETHKTAYMPVFKMCLVTPLIATGIMILASLVML